MQPVIVLSDSLSGLDPIDGVGFLRWGNFREEMLDAGGGSALAWSGPPVIGAILTLSLIHI